MARASKKKRVVKPKSRQEESKISDPDSKIIYRTTISEIGEDKEKPRKRVSKPKSRKKISKVKKKASKKPASRKKKVLKISSEKREIERIERKISSERDKDISKALTDNFIALQKVMVNLSLKFDNLSTQISKLLELFEISAKSLAQKDFEKDRENKESLEIIKKLDNISQQAGLIGKGLVLIHEASSEKGFAPREESHEEKMRGMIPSRNLRPSPRYPPESLRKEIGEQNPQNKVNQIQIQKKPLQSQNIPQQNQAPELESQNQPQNPEGPSTKEIEE